MDTGDMCKDAASFWTPLPPLHVCQRYGIALDCADLKATMKNLLACLAILAAFNVTAQTETSNFPYNPDTNGDGLIGVADLIVLLGYYESQFDIEAQLSPDSTSAIYIPEDWLSMSIGFTNCASRCDSLPGPWHIMSHAGFASHFGTIRQLVTNSLSINGGQRNFWQLDWGPARPSTTQEIQYPIHRVRIGSPTYYDYADPVNASFTDEGNGDDPFIRCLCELRQRPRVEYDFCEGSMANIQPCAAEKVSQGWYPLELTSAGGAVFVQTFWRWED